MYPAQTTSNHDSTSHTHSNKYAYSLYATDSATLCHAVLIFNALEKFGSKADRVLFYPDYWDLVVDSKLDRDSQLLVEAKKRYKVKLQPIKLLSVAGRTSGTFLDTLSLALWHQRDKLLTGALQMHGSTPGTNRSQNLWPFP